MLTPAETRRLDQIEAKLDRLLAVMAPTPLQGGMDVKAAIYASGGVDALKDHMRAEARSAAERAGVKP